MDKFNNFLLGLVAGEPLVKVGDDVHADLTGQGVAGGGNCGGSEDQAGEEEKDLKLKTRVFYRNSL